MSVEAFVNMQNARIYLTGILHDVGLTGEEANLVLNAAVLYAEATGLLRVNETLERLNAEIGQT